MGKDRLPTIIFQRRAVKLRGGLPGVITTQNEQKETIVGFRFATDRCLEQVPLDRCSEQVPSSIFSQMLVS